MAKKDGKYIVLQVGTSVFTGLVSNDFNFNIDTIDTTSKDSDGHKEYIAGEDDGDFSASALYDPSGTYSLNEIVAAANAKIPVSVTMGGTANGDQYVTCDCVIVSVKWGAPKNGASTVDASFKKTGGIAFGTVSDAVAPVLEAAYINNPTPTVLRLQFSEELDANYKPASSVWTIAGVSKTISSYSISGKNVAITVTVAFASGDAPTIAYTNPGAGGIRDKSGNVLVTFTAEAVTNNVSA